MNNPTQPLIRDRSEIVRFFRWLFSWRGLRRILIVLAWAVTLVALIHAEENWRGRRAWNNYRRQLEAKGEPLDWQALIPKPVPDDQNFAATPFVKTWLAKGDPADRDRWYDKDDYSRVGSLISTSQTRKDGGQRRFTDLVAWQMALDAMRSGKVDRHQRFESDRFDPESRAKAAPAVLEILKTNEAVFAELRVASQRPYARYPVIYNQANPWAIVVSHLASIKAVCLRLQLRACAELAVNRNEEALEDVKLMLYLADTVKEEPFLISDLVRLAGVQLAVQPIWEGLAEHRWSDAQLQELQTRLQSYNFLADLQRSLAAERAAGILTADLLRKYGFTYLNTVGDTVSSPRSSPALVKLTGRIIFPSGWFYQEQFNYCRLFQLQLEGTFDTVQKTVSPSRSAANDQAFEQELSEGGQGFGALAHHRLLARMLLPAIGKVSRRAAKTQTTADEAALACTLERYRLANGQFPDKLEALVPRFIAQLPNDVITGHPYRYRQTANPPGQGSVAADGQFVLYSVGWNEKDDGGTPGKVMFDEKLGDWVWEYPAK